MEIKNEELSNLQIQIPWTFLNCTGAKGLWKEKCSLTNRHERLVRLQGEASPHNLGTRFERFASCSHAQVQTR